MSQTEGKKSFSPVRFLKEVKQEANKVAWPTRKDTIATTGMVLVIIFLASLYLFGIDQVIAYGVKLLLGI
jgi:preprotein translocase subunit SecE